MKKFKKFFALVAVAVLGLFTLASCGTTAPKIKSAFESKDYTVETRTIENEDSVLKGIYVANKGLHFALFIELGTTDDLEAAISELQKNEEYKTALEQFGKDAKAIAEKLTEEGLVNGNCILISIDPEARTIFKEA